LYTSVAKRPPYWKYPALLKHYITITRLYSHAPTDTSQNSWIKTIKYICKGLHSHFTNTFILLISRRYTCIPLLLCDRRIENTTSILKHYITITRLYSHAPTDTSQNIYAPVLHAHFTNTFILLISRRYTCIPLLLGGRHIENTAPILKHYITITCLYSHAPTDTSQNIYAPVLHAHFTNTIILLISRRYTYIPLLLDGRHIENTTPILKHYITITRLYSHAPTDTSQNIYAPVLHAHFTNTFILLISRRYTCIPLLLGGRHIENTTPILKHYITITRLYSHAPTDISQNIYAPVLHAHFTNTFIFIN